MEEVDLLSLGGLVFDWMAGGKSHRKSTEKGVTAKIVQTTRLEQSNPETSIGTTSTRVIRNPELPVLKHDIQTVINNLMVPNQTSSEADNEDSIFSVLTEPRKCEEINETSTTEDTSVLVNVPIVSSVDLMEALDSQTLTPPLPPPCCPHHHHHHMGPHGEQYLPPSAFHSYTSCPQPCPIDYRTTIGGAPSGFKVEGPKRVTDWIRDWYRDSLRNYKWRNGERKSALGLTFDGIPDRKHVKIMYPEKDTSGTNKTTVVNTCLTGGGPTLAANSRKTATFSIDGDRTEERQRRADFYYFDHGNAQYYHTTDYPPVLLCDIVAERTEKYTTKIWSELFGSIHIFVAFVTSFFLQFLRFILYTVCRPLTVGIMQMGSDYFLKPFLATLFNAVIQPPLIFAYNIATSIRDMLDPISEGLGYFLREIAVVIRACRLVEIKKNTSSACGTNCPECGCTNKHCIINHTLNNNNNNRNCGDIGGKSNKH